VILRTAVAAGRNELSLDKRPVVLEKVLDHDFVLCL